MARSRTIPILLAALALAYVGSYGAFKIRAIRIARTYEIKGYYFVGILDDESIARERIFRRFYAPLIWCDVTLLRGERPAPPADRELR